MKCMEEKILSLLILIIFSLAFPAILISIVVPFEMRDNLSLGTGILFVYAIGVTVMYLKGIDVK